MMEKITTIIPDNQIPKFRVQETITTIVNLDRTSLFEKQRQALLEKLKVSLLAGGSMSDDQFNEVLRHTLDWSREYFLIFLVEFINTLPRYYLVDRGGLMPETELIFIQNLRQMVNHTQTEWKKQDLKMERELNG